MSANPIKKGYGLPFTSEQSGRGFESVFGLRGRESETCSRILGVARLWLTFTIID